MVMRDIFIIIILHGTILVIFQFIYGILVKLQEETIMYDSYYVINCDDKEITRKLFAVLFSYSDSFSLLYYKRVENEKFKNTVKDIQKQLQKYIIGSKKVLEWPLTKQLNDHKPICQLVTYKSSMETFFILENVGCLWDWDYPYYPSDIAFYKNGFAWFESCSHERMNTLYVRKEDGYPLISDMESIGIELEPEGKVYQERLFFNEQAILPMRKDENQSESIVNIEKIENQITINANMEGLRNIAREIAVLMSDEAGASTQIATSNDNCMKLQIKKTE